MLLLDTNVLVYAHDPRDRTKQARALRVLERLVPTGRAVVSVQCLSEFFQVVTRRLPDPLPPAVAHTRVERLTQTCLVLDLTAPAVLEGCRGVVEHGLSLWDALIWAVAKLHQVPTILTEDAEHGRLLEGVRYLNPFLPTFDLATL